MVDGHSSIEVDDSTAVAKSGQDWSWSETCGYVGPSEERCNEPPEYVCRALESPATDRNSWVEMCSRHAEMYAEGSLVHLVDDEGTTRLHWQLSPEQLKARRDEQLAVGRAKLALQEHEYGMKVDDLPAHAEVVLRAVQRQLRRYELGHELPPHLAWELSRWQWAARRVRGVKPLQVERAAADGGAPRTVCYGTSVDHEEGKPKHTGILVADVVTLTDEEGEIVVPWPNRIRSIPAAGCNRIFEFSDRLRTWCDDCEKKKVARGQIRLVKRRHKRRASERLSPGSPE
jgi:hypothetical protein